ncbi:MAG: hypothetical protein P8Y60_12155 [Calditrichota bacterium]
MKQGIVLLAPARLFGDAAVKSSLASRQAGGSLASFQKNWQKVNPD